MRFLRTRRDVTLRITAPDDAEPRAFEALVLAGRGHGAAERIEGRTPFLRRLPDIDVTLVVAPTDPGPALEVAYEVTRRGRSVMAGRSWCPIAVIDRRRGRIVAGGLDGAPGDGGAGTPAVLRAM